jgi:tetratricopeptide (TPR) repeat protein
MTAPELLMQRAKDERRAGDTAAAEASYAEAASLAETQELPHLRAHALRHVAELAAEQGAGERALEAAEEALAIYASDAGTHRLNVANARRVRALALAALGRNEDSAEAWRAAREIYEALGIDAGVAECDRRLSPA